MAEELKDAFDVVEICQRLQDAIQKSYVDNGKMAGRKIPDGLFLTIELWVDRGEVILVKKTNKS